tara:strand:- start:17702 stop:19300 length:1599 start_codon:yes stop_codon:yes gene_type:complete
MTFNSLNQFPVLQYTTPKKLLSFLLLGFILFILLPFHNATAQELSERTKWSIGFHAGVLSGNLPTITATNIISSRFNVENDYYFTAAFKTGYSLSEYESLYLNISKGDFSLITDYDFWPDVRFDNQFYTANLSIKLGLRRFLESLPNRLDPYGSFGLGLMSSNNTVSSLDLEDTAQDDYSDVTSSDLSYFFNAGVGLDLSISSRVSIFLEFNQSFMSSDIIDKDLAGGVLRNDFIQTINNWSTYTSGIRIKFGKTKPQPQPEPFRDDFQIVSTINVDQLSELDDQDSDPDNDTDEITTEPDSSNVVRAIPEPILPDSTVENQTTEEIDEAGDEVDENVTEPDSVTVVLATPEPILPDSTVESQTTEEIDEDGDEVDENTTEPDSTETDMTISESVNDEDTTDNQVSEEITESETVDPQGDTDSGMNELIENNGDEIMFATQPRYGLTGVSVEQIPGSYTINLHSYTNQDDANSVIVQLAADGYRVVTQTANVNGIDYFRVGVGQFESIRDARAATVNLPEVYRRNHFIIQVN